MELLRRTPPWAWAARRWTHHDGQMANRKRGVPGSQARWEAYAAVTALFLWQKIALDTRGGITLVGDALGVLFGTATLRSKDKHINRLMMELALLLAPTGHCLEALHIWSEDNDLADKLSRLDIHENAPNELDTVSRTPWSETMWWKIVLETL